MVWDCIIVGGGIAGLQAAIQLGRYAMHNVLVLDAGEGRSAICRSYRNILGYPEGVSGSDLRATGTEQAAAYGVQFIRDKVMRAKALPSGSFLLHGRQDGSSYEARTLLLATGVMDRFPDLPGLRECLGLTVYVCPDCDGFEAKDRRTLILGAGDAGARMSMTLQIWTNKLLYINHGRSQGQVSAELLHSLHAGGIDYLEAVSERVAGTEDGCFRGIVLEDGRLIEAERAFLAFGGNEVRSALAEQLGARLHENKHIWTDSRSKMTSVPKVWAAGDVAAHAEQVTIAMGEGAQAAIWIHKTLLELKRTSACT
ncbi:NAD(P)/FAD-dependent oxidoreductase [Paenibacillus solisilvae]|uniref:NAD(P)/FAD-dependent oxidoreductase n=1 Tax=Paenibacillus solisilvae TaxID=2486751 RepID=A0ABW0W3W9_9BACL